LDHWINTFLATHIKENIRWPNWSVYYLWQQTNIS